MAKTINQLLEEANTIKNEITPGANTAERIGNMCKDIVDFLNDNQPAEQLQADWNQGNTSAKDYIKNKPTIPAAQVQSDWNATTGMGVILNKPTIPDLSEVVSKSEIVVTKEDSSSVRTSDDQIHDITTFIIGCSDNADSDTGYCTIIKVMYSDVQYSIIRIESISNTIFKVSGYLEYSGTTFSLSSIGGSYQEYVITRGGSSLTQITPLLAAFSYNSGTATLNITQ